MCYTDGSCFVAKKEQEARQPRRNLGMEYNKHIAEMATGDEVEGFYVLKTAASKVSNSGKPFLAATLADCTGTIETKVWDYSGPIGPADEGTVIKVRGNVSEYRGALQLVAGRIRAVQEGDQYDLGNLVPVAPLDKAEALREVQTIVGTISDSDYAGICRWMLKKYGEQFASIPAGKSMHHSFLNGLLMHTLYMLRTADYLAELYHAVIDRGLLLTGTLLHDFAKCAEFTISPLGLVSDYSVKGQLLGHLAMGAQWAAEAARELNVPEEKSVLLQHMILSHHGEPTFGAAVRPACAESELLSLIDLIDSRMEIYTEVLDETEVGQFSRRVLALENRKLYRHEMTD